MIIVALWKVNLFISWQLVVRSGGQHDATGIGTGKELVPIRAELKV